MSVDSGLEPDMVPTLDEFLLARIAEDKRIAVDAATAAGRESWQAGDVAVPSPASLHRTEHVARHDPARVLVECAAKRRLVLACRDAGFDRSFLGARPPGLADFPLPPRDQHQLAALTLGLLALPYAAHHDYRPEWRP
ncbi:hypothetical protein FHU33_2232 [Blastococcus colisei]|uniref:Uncharacterized protein n=1 Tax=Blastococcus colisei TaxID=1564162 RepID=A0A543PFH2_9ACTN|nr:DUF6221 family protein [Blastococcus colisei]TQN42823.1 hypothetical protein FHU33_2232 [Blastococcus colisei]